MSSFSTYDFEESVKGETSLEDIARVVAAWGNVDSEGACCEECGGEWTGGFLCEKKDGSFIYITGWCDYTGWGCRDGTKSTAYQLQPELSALEKFPESVWDKDPPDLNKFLGVTI